MARDPSATKWIQGTSKSIKEREAKIGDYYKRFVAGKETPTKADVTALEKQITEFEKMVELIVADLGEMERVVVGLGPRNDSSKLHNNRILLTTIKKDAK